MKRSSWLSFAFFCLIFAVSMWGCGGGSIGTGGDTRRLEGTLTRNGAPISNAEVRVDETGESSMTDEQGDFSLPLPKSLSSIHIQFVIADMEHALTVSDIPNDTAIVHMECSYDDVGNVKLESVDFVRPAAD